MALDCKGCREEVRVDEPDKKWRRVQWGDNTVRSDEPESDETLARPNPSTTIWCRAETASELGFLLPIQEFSPGPVVWQPVNHFVGSSHQHKWPKHMNDYGLLKFCHPSL